MLSKLCVTVGGILTLVIAIFHTRFYSLFKWKKEFKKIGVLKGKIHYTIHLALLFLFFGFGILSILFADILSECENLALGLMILFSLFWLWRTIWQIIYFRSAKGKKRISGISYFFLILFLLLFIVYTIPVYITFASDKKKLPQKIMQKAKIADYKVNKSNRKITHTIKESDVSTEKISTSEKEIIEEKEREILSEADLWKKYKLAKENLETAKISENFNGIIKSLITAAQYAHRLNRRDIEAWQYNNIGYYSIQEFMRLTDYQTRMSTLESMDPGKEKAANIRKTKSILKTHFNILKDAAPYLEKAGNLDKNLDDPERTNKIQSNIKYIEWIENFIETDNNN